jgi:hypothetical protein
VSAGASIGLTGLGNAESGQFHQLIDGEASILTHEFFIEVCCLLGTKRLECQKCVSFILTYIDSLWLPTLLIGGPRVDRARQYLCRGWLTFKVILENFWTVNAGLMILLGRNVRSIELRLDLI